MQASVVRLPGARRLSQNLAIACLAVAALAVTPASAASNVVQYAFDAAGNIVSIQRANPAPISISGFAPTSGPVGTMVTISGAGFSPTAAGNRVTFNGVVAPAVAATGTKLTVAVPSGATTGKIAVTVAGNSAVSTQDFVVMAPGAPTITGFAPAAGPAGAAVTVTGTNFNPAAGATTVKLNQNAATAASTTATQLTLAVPAATGSGKIRVTTSAGTAVSATDFIVPPGATLASDIVATARLVANGPAQTVGIFTSNKVGLILFDGNAGDWLSLQIANFAINPASGTISYTVFKPDNMQLATGTLSATNLTIHVPQLPAAGTYAVLLRSGITQVSLDARLETNLFIPVDRSMAVAARSVGQTTRALIAAMAGDQKALMVSALSTLPAATSLGYTIALPSGSTLRNGSAFGLGTTTQLSPFTVTGTHAVVFTPTSATMQTSFKLALLAGVALPVDGAAVNLAIADPGEGARLNFGGVAGQNLGIGITGLALSPASVTNSSFSVYRPDATLLASGNCFADGTQCSANVPNLPVTGNYSVIVQPASGATGTMQVWLSRDVAGTLTSGTPYSLALARPGQNGRLTFPGVAGALIAVQVRGVATTPTGQGILVLVNQPDGSLFAFTRLTGSGQTIVTPPLPVTGTYTVFAEPESTAKGAATASMEILLDPGQNLVIDGPMQSSTIGIAGASVRYTFAGTAGQNLGLGVSNLALIPLSDATVWVYKPDGASLIGISCSGTVGGCGANLTNLPSTGRYGIVVTPGSGATGGFSVTLSSDVAGNLAFDVPAALALSRPGQNGHLTFAANAGDSVMLAFSRIATQPAGQFVYLTLNKPDGTALYAIATATASGSIYMASLPVTGTYRIFVDPIHHYTANVTITRLAGIPLPIDGAPVTSILANPGDAARYTFAGTAGQNLGLGLAGMTMMPAAAGHQLTIFGPTGAQAGSALCYAQYGGCSVNLTNLAATGSYSAVVQSTQGGVGNYTIALSTDLAGTLTLGGAALPISLYRPGLNARLSVAATAGQMLRLYWSGVAIAGAASNALATIYKPDGSVLGGLQLANGVAGSYDLPALPATGNYTLFIDPPAGATLTTTLTLAAR